MIARVEWSHAPARQPAKEAAGMRGLGYLITAGILLGSCASPSPQPAAPAASAPAPATTASGATAATPVAAPTAAPAPVSVRYGIAATSLNFLPARMAVEQGFYRQYGLDVDVVQIAAGSQTAAQLSGELEYSTAYPPAIRLAANGGPLRVVSTLVGAPLFVMLGRPPEVTTTADLRGKAVGITTRGGAQDKSTRDMLLKLGYDPE